MTAKPANKQELRLVAIRIGNVALTGFLIVICLFLFLLATRQSRSALQVALPLANNDLAQEARAVVIYYKPQCACSNNIQQWVASATKQSNVYILSNGWHPDLNALKPNASSPNTVKIISQTNYLLGALFFPNSDITVTTMEKGRIVRQLHGKEATTLLDQGGAI